MKTRTSTSERNEHNDARARVESHPDAPQPPQHQPKPGIEEDLTPKPRYRAPAYKPAGKLQDKVALITGGDSGIGRAVAVMYAREGADVVITCLPSESRDARKTVEEIQRAGRRGHIVYGDLADPNFCRSLVRETLSEFSKLDILVSNAAHQNHKSSLEEIDDAEFDRTFKVNVYAYFRLVKAAVPHMKPGSSIIVTSSETAWTGSQGLLDYSGTKGAINTMTKALAKMLVEKGIRVNAVAPGPVWTPLNVADKGNDEKKVAHFGEKSPMGRPAQPEEVAPSYVFLASEADSSYITGEILAVMGGERVAG